MKTGLAIEDSRETGIWLGSLLEKAFPEITVEICETYVDAMDKVNSTYFSILLVDLNLSYNEGINLISYVRERAPDAYIVASSIHDDDYHLLNSFKVGVHGYLLKDMAEGIYVNKLRGIINGDPPLAPSIARKMLRLLSGTQLTAPLQASRTELSPRETEVLTFIAKGYNRKEIARILGLSANTIARYIRDIYHRLNISNKSEATLEACRLGLIDPLNLH